MLDLIPWLQKIAFTVNSLSDFFAALNLTLFKTANRNTDSAAIPLVAIKPLESDVESNSARLQVDDCLTSGRV